MSKRISPKRYIYENGKLIIKYKENESSQVDLNKNIEFFKEEDSKKNKYPGFSPKNIINNNYKIFSTELDGDILNDIKKNDSEKNKSFNNEYESYDNNKGEKKDNNDYNNENTTNFKSIEINPSNFRKNQRLIHKLNNSKISTDIERMCKYLYTSPRKDENNIKFKMFEKESEYVKGLTKKNYLVDEDLINKQTYRNKIKRRKNNQSNLNLLNSIKNNNILTDSEVIKRYYNEEIPKTIDIDKLTRYNFENFSRNLPRYKHPQLYMLRSLNKKLEGNYIKLPPIKTGNQTPIELTEFIPVKKGINKEEQRKEYFFYKVMRNSRLEGFHIK